MASHYDTTSVVIHGRADGDLAAGREGAAPKGGADEVEAEAHKTYGRRVNHR